MLQQLLPRAAVVILLFVGAVFTYFESIYLQDQAAEIGRDASKIEFWMWIFRGLTFGFAALGIWIALLTYRRMIAP